MFPHPDTVCTLSALDYQEGLRDAAKERLGARTQTTARSRSLHPRPALLAAAAWRKELVARVHGIEPVRLSRVLTTG